MGSRTGVEPDVTQTFVERIVNALDITIPELATIIADDPAQRRQIISDLNRMVAVGANELPELDRDYTWFKIEAYVDQQLAYLLATKAELNRLLSRQRTQRVVRQGQQSDRQYVPPPRSLVRRTPDGR